MTKDEWLNFQETKGESLVGKRCSVPAEYMGSMWLYRNHPWETGTIVKLTKSNMVGVVTATSGKNIRSFPYDLVELIGDEG